MEAVIIKIETIWAGEDVYSAAKRIVAARANSDEIHIDVNLTDALYVYLKAQGFL